jgi:hypothetical protein
MSKYLYGYKLGILLKNGDFKNHDIAESPCTETFFSFMWIVPKVRYKQEQHTDVKHKTQYCNRMCREGVGIPVVTATAVYVQACRSSGTGCMSGKLDLYGGVSCYLVPAHTTQTNDPSLQEACLLPAYRKQVSV